jgi:hypothetical protein
MDNTSFEIVAPWSNTTTNTTNNNNKNKAPFKRVRVVGKSTSYLTTNKNKRIKIKDNVKGFTTAYINTVNKYLHKQLNQTGTAATIEPEEAFEHLKSLNLFDRNAKSLHSLEDTPIGNLINKKARKHNKKVKNTLKGYSIWAAVTYKQKETGRIAHTQNAMSIKSYKTKDEFTPEFIEESARDWMEKTG